MMKIQMVDLKKQLDGIREELVAAVTEVLEQHALHTRPEGQEF
jgi:hypothetical protein